MDRLIENVIVPALLARLLAQRQPSPDAAQELGAPTRVESQPPA